MRKLSRWWLDMNARGHVAHDSGRHHLRLDVGVSLLHTLYLSIPLFCFGLFLLVTAFLARCQMFYPA